MCRSQNLVSLLQLLGKLLLKLSERCLGMRRILRKIAANELDNLGDTTTLADPAVVQELIDNRANR